MVLLNQHHYDHDRPSDVVTNDDNNVITTRSGMTTNNDNHSNNNNINYYNTNNYYHPPISTYTNYRIQRLPLYIFEHLLISSSSINTRATGSNDDDDRIITISTNTTSIDTKQQGRLLLPVVASPAAQEQNNTSKHDSNTTTTTVGGNDSDNDIVRNTSPEYIRDTIVSKLQSYLVVSQQQQPKVQNQSTTMKTTTITTTRSTTNEDDDINDSTKNDNDNNNTLLTTTTPNFSTWSGGGGGSGSSGSKDITVGFVLQLSIVSLVSLFDPLLTYNECYEFYKRICRFCSPKSITASNLLLGYNTNNNSNNNNNNNNTVGRRTATTTTMNSTARTIRKLFVSTGMPSFDAYLRGGIRIGTVTEIVGTAGCGKTQFAMQVAIQLLVASSSSSTTTSSLLFNEKGSTIYFDTERKLSIVRLQEMIQHTTTTVTTTTTTTVPNQKQRQTQQQQQQQMNEVLENIMIHTVTSDTTKDLLTLLQDIEDILIERQDEELFQNDDNDPFVTNTTPNDRISSSLLLSKSRRNPVRLIVLDSIAAVASTSSNGNELSVMDRSIVNLQIAQLLKRYADQFQLAVLVTNQMVVSQPVTNNNAIIDNRTVDNTYSSSSSSSSTIPALGISWHHCVSTRIQLLYNDDNNDNVTDDHPTRKRCIMVRKSNMVAPTRDPIYFTITSKGLIGI